ncbi:MAG: HAMP domain-containing sensor histidine kinase [Acidobacteriota bacterium]
MSRTRRWWLIYWIAVGAVLAGLTFATVQVGRGARIEAERLAENEHRATLKVALSRLDTWLSGFLAQEASRPASDYRLYEPEWSDLSRVRSEYIDYHFEWCSGGGVNSPWRRDKDSARDRELKALQMALSGTLGRTLLDESSAGAEQASGRGVQLTALGGGSTGCVAPESQPKCRFSSMASAWWTHGDDTTLVVARRIADAEALQGFVVDWSTLRGELIEQAGGLVPDLELRPQSSGAAPVAEAAMALTALPINLMAPPPRPPSYWASLPWLPLGLTWLGTAVALIAVGFTLRASIRMAEDQRLFAMAISHELRTPLTTFRLHSELLADDMVTDEAQRAESLALLKRESGRLAGLVENVLEQLRLEAGHDALSSERLSISELLDRLLPPLRERAEARERVLEVGELPEPEREIVVAVPLVARILENLVDNALSHGNGSDDGRIHLEADTCGRFLALRVRDHGPGVPRERRRQVFVPFASGGIANSDGSGGCGFGLALCRELAVRLRGELSYFAPAGGGAGFELRLPFRG